MVLLTKNQITMTTKGAFSLDEYKQSYKEGVQDEKDIKMRKISK